MTGLRLLLAVLLLAGNAFFVGAQFALVAVRADQIEPHARAGSRRARAAAGQVRALPDLLAGSQLGIALCSLGLGAVAEPAVAHLLDGGFGLVRIPATLVHPLALAVALVAVAYCHMVIGEMVPKNLALAGTVRAALLFGPPMAGWVRLTRPVLWVLNALATLVLAAWRVSPREELSRAYGPTELAEMIAESTAEGLLDPDQRQRLVRALALGRRTARVVTIPLDRLVTVSRTTTPVELERLVSATGYSRFPVLDRTGHPPGAGHPDGRADFAGFLHAKDIMEVARRDAPVPARLYRPMPVIDIDLPLSHALATLRRAGGHLGRVIDAGRTVGAVALEDVIAEFVGEVHDASHRAP
ncbi:MAG TPA: hemolysin family protein [Mycobacteriales bacterium]|nr:hemolysin family protein [Mycobacteriales bacterium]